MNRMRAFLAMGMVSALTTLLAGCGTGSAPPPAARSKSPHTQPSAPGHRVQTTAGPVSRFPLWIDFLSPQVGWVSVVQEIPAPNPTGYRTNVTLYRTENGGRSWTKQAVFPRNGSLAAGWVRFFNGQAGVAIGAGGHTLLRTTDGGTAWSTVPLPTGISDPAMITFAGPENVWILSIGTGASGSEEATIYHSADGGTRWNVVNRTPPIVAPQGTLPAEGQMPVYGDKSGISFANANDGWATGSVNALGGSWLYHSSDGGAQWQSVSLGLPRSWSGAEIATHPPRFFPSGNGVLPISADTRLYLSFTSDGGRQWGAPVLLPGAPSAANGALQPQQVWTFLNPASGWVATGNRLWATRDGGVDWRSFQLPKTQGSFERLDFVTPQIGFAIAGKGFAGTGPATLLQTVDGGRTWHPLPTPAP